MAVFGRLHAWKGQHIAIDALAQLPADCQLWIVGGPLFGEHDFEAQLHAQVERHGLVPRVRFLGFRHDVPALMKAADVVVHASTLPEPFGRVLVEGMLAGRPVIATAAGGVAEIITDGETGRLVPCADAGAMARAVSALRADPAHAAAIAAAGNQRARDVFGVDAMVRGVRAVLDEVAG
jgi:glycosyltransferase involved in cell wall biosynthesis